MSNRRSVVPVSLGLIVLAGLGWWIARPQAPVVKEHGGITVKEHAGKEHAGAVLKEHAGKEHAGMTILKEHAGEEHAGKEHARVATAE